MKQKVLFSIIVIAILGIQNVTAQTIFSTKEEVAEYLEGEWNLDVVQGGFAGGTYYLPSPIYYDSTVHKIIFEITDIDSTPLVCKALIDDTLYQETFVSISENPSQILLPRWLLFNLPDNLEHSVGLMEEMGFYGFSQDTVVLGGNMVADGYEFGLSRLITGTEETYEFGDIKIYPNPSNGRIFIEGIRPNTQYEIFDINGKLVGTGKWNDNFLILENFGIYILKLEIQNGWISKKIVINE